MLGIIVNGGHPLSFLFSCKPVSQHQVIVSNTTSSENCSMYTVSQASLLATGLSWCRASFKIKKTTPVILPHQELTPGILSDREIGPGHPSKSWTDSPPAPFQIEKLTPDIFPNLEIDPPASFRIKKLTPGILPNHEIDPGHPSETKKIDLGHPYKSRDWPSDILSNREIDPRKPSK